MVGRAITAAKDKTGMLLYSEHEELERRFVEEISNLSENDPVYFLVNGKCLNRGNKD